jgi:hypothetical protein
MSSRNSTRPGTARTTRCQASSAAQVTIRCSRRWPDTSAPKGSDHSAVGPVQPCAGDLKAQDRDLVLRHQDLRFLSGIAPARSASQPDSRTQRRPRRETVPAGPLRTAFQRRRPSPGGPVLVTGHLHGTRYKPDPQPRPPLLGQRPHPRPGARPRRRADHLPAARLTRPGAGTELAAHLRRAPWFVILRMPLPSPR